MPSSQRVADQSAHRRAEAPKHADEAADAEALAASLKLASARVRRLEAAVEAEESALVQLSLTEAELAVAAAGSSDRQRTTRQVEQKLQGRVGHARQLLAAEKARLRTSLGHGNTQLALAVEQGVDTYFTDMHAMRAERRAAQNTAARVAQPGSMLRRLHEEERRLGDAVRSLRAEIDELSADEHAAAASRRELTEVLRRREYGMDHFATVADIASVVAAVGGG